MKVVRALLYICTLIVFVVVVLGAYVRLSDAGLGCPDWPGCYGHLIGVPDTQHEIEHATRAFPESTLVVQKAWKEMIHRYLAGGFGLMILALVVTTILFRKQCTLSPVLPILLAGLVVIQALLGMWTVTLQLKPLVVMLHLLGGFLILSLLWWAVLRMRDNRVANVSMFSAAHSWSVLFGIALLVAQISLGGWTSANYAALACVDFPTCHGQWWPTTDFANAFSLWSVEIRNYEYGVLDSPARTAIHLSHRIGAALVLLFWAGLCFFLISRDQSYVRGVALTILVLLFSQIALGITNVLAHLPLTVAVLHNACAALLLLSTITLLHVLIYSPSQK